jgi:glyoxylase-like metal-dependent hydrolase (beta-lactamase superfamily II)
MTTSAVPLSPAQFEASHDSRRPASEIVADGVWAIASPIPEGQIPYTLTYVLKTGQDELVLIDPGWDTDENFSTLDNSLRGLGCRLEHVTATISTHFHPDHLGIAERLRDAVGAKVMLSATEQDVLRH